MKRILLIFGLLYSAFSFATERGDTLKMMTYNIRFGELATMEEIGEYIASEDLDIVALQECDWATNRSRTPHQHGVKFMNDLAYHSGLFGIYGKSINFSGGYYGIGILSKYPILRYERVLLPNDGKTEQRSMLIADIELPGGKVITFVNTHLEVKTAQMRIQQVKFIQKYLKKYKNPIILAGDMNAIPDTKEMEMLRKNWKDVTNKAFTYHSENPKVKIDYIYAKPANKVIILQTTVRQSIKLSDHFPVVSAIVLK